MNSKFIAMGEYHMSIQNENYSIEELCEEKKFFSQIPHLIHRMGLGAYVVAYYCLLKSISGEKRSCFMSQSNLALLIGCSDRQIRLMNEFMSQPFAILNGKPLIRVVRRKSENGTLMPNVIQLVSIWSESVTVIENKSIIPQTPMKEWLRKIKNKSSTEPRSAPSGTTFRTPPELRSDKEEETIEEEIFKKNDIDSEACKVEVQHVPIEVEKEKEPQACADDYRSSDMDDSIVSYDSETFFNAETYKLPDGSNLSKRMIHSLNKYGPEERFKLITNIRYFEECIKKGRKPRDSYEIMLQGYIKNDYASQQNNVTQNHLFAIVMKETYKLKGLDVLKTVVRMKRGLNEQSDSISMSLPTDTFASIIREYKDKHAESSSAK